MINKHKFCSIALVSTAMILILVNIAGAVQLAHITNNGNNNLSVITKQTPTITWSNPTNITYGTSLSSTQLDANASNTVSRAPVSGTFVYTPPLGTVLSLGSQQTLNTTFTPTDTANYTTTTASVSINVLRPTAAYITNSGSNNVSIINTATNKVTATVPVGNTPIGVAVSPDNTKIYVANLGSNSVSVINTTTNAVTTSVNVGNSPVGVAATPDGTKVYVANEYSNTVSVINTTTNTVTATVTGMSLPLGVAAAPDGTRVYVTNYGANTVSVINTTTNTKATVTGLNHPYGIAVTPDGKKVYVANYGTNNVSVIDTTTNTVTTSVNVGNSPVGVAATPDGTKVYVVNSNYGSSGTVSVINTTTNTVTNSVNVGTTPYGVAVTPDGTTVYVDNDGTNNVSVINTTTNTVTAVKVGTTPKAFGQFVGYIPATPIITWSNPANITYGTALNSTQLDATSSVHGTFVYNPLSGTVLSLGTHTLNTTFTPNDTANYTTASGSVSINVTQATPTITWNNPANITYGTPLSNTQLDATSSVPGSFVYNPATGTVLSIGTQTLNTIFTPTDTANYTTASASVLINVTQATPIVIWSNPADITYGTVLSNAQLDATTSVPGNFVYTPTAGTILGAGLSQTLSTTFTPTDTTNYTTAIDSVSINVTQITPTITWNNPADITYGTALSDAQLDATTSVPGNFVYTPIAGTILGAGLSQTLSTTFTPTDTTNYTTAIDSVSINVTQITPTITWNNPADITYGTALSDAQLDANASDPVSGVTVSGTFIYNPAAGTILGAGLDQALNTAFTPTDTTNYTTASASVSINVTQSTPTITWSNPANITYGTPLSSTQLDANASNTVSGDTVPGTFAYTPPSGTVFESVGTQILSTTFTPTDTANYTTASASVLINVTQATPIIIWSNPANITYGTPLSNTQLDATSSVPGYFVYIQSPGTVLSAGTQMLNALFIPNDLVDYYITSATVSINVTQPAPPVLAYITNYESSNVSVIDTATSTVTATVNLEDANYVAYPWGVAVAPDGTTVYVTEYRSNKNDNRDYGCNVSVIDTATNTVTAVVNLDEPNFNPYGVAVSPDGAKLYVVDNIDYPGQNPPEYPVVKVFNTTDYSYTSVPVGAAPRLLNGIAVTPDGTKAYVANTDVGNTGADHQVAVIDTATNTVTATVLVGNDPNGVAVSPDGAKVYVSNMYDNNVSVIDTATNTVTASVPVGNYPNGVAVAPDGSKVYVANGGYNDVSVIDTATNTVTATVPTGTNPQGVSVTPDGTKVYVANWGNQPGEVSVIDTTTNTVITNVPVGTDPVAFGQFIGTPPL